MRGRQGLSTCPWTIERIQKCLNAFDGSGRIVVLANREPIRHDQRPSWQYDRRLPNAGRLPEFHADGRAFARRPRRPQAERDYLRRSTDGSSRLSGVGRMAESLGVSIAVYRDVPGGRRPTASPAAERPPGRRCGSGALCPCPDCRAKSKTVCLPTASFERACRTHLVASNRRFASTGTAASRRGDSVLYSNHLTPR